MANINAVVLELEEKRMLETTIAAAVEAAAIVAKHQPTRKNKRVLKSRLSWCKTNRGQINNLTGMLLDELRREISPEDRKMYVRPWPYAHWTPTGGRPSSDDKPARREAGSQGAG